MAAVVCSESLYDLHLEQKGSLRRGKLYHFNREKLPSYQGVLQLFDG